MHMNRVKLKDSLVYMTAYPPDPQCIYRFPWSSSPTTNKSHAIIADEITPTSALGVKSVPKTQFSKTTDYSSSDYLSKHHSEQG